MQACYRSELVTGDILIQTRHASKKLQCECCEQAQPTWCLNPEQDCANEITKGNDILSIYRVSLHQDMLTICVVYLSWRLATNKEMTDLPTWLCNVHVRPAHATDLVAASNAATSGQLNVCCKTWPESLDEWTRILHLRSSWLPRLRNLHRKSVEENSNSLHMSNPLHVGNSHARIANEEFVSCTLCTKDNGPRAQNSHKSRMGTLLRSLWSLNILDEARMTCQPGIRDPSQCVFLQTKNQLWVCRNCPHPKANPKNSPNNAPDQSQTNPRLVYEEPAHLGLCIRRHRTALPWIPKNKIYKLFTLHGILYTPSWKTARMCLILKNWGKWEIWTNACNYNASMQYCMT